MLPPWYRPGRPNSAKNTRSWRASERGYHSGVAATATQTDTSKELDRPVPWNVVLLNDDDHSFEDVIAMLTALFGYPQEKGFQIAERVDREGRAVCFTTHKEHAELKREQVISYIHEGTGAMSAIIEPAEFGDEDDLNPPD